MVLINGVKYACERCIRGHRVTTCTHTDQPLTMIKPKGRPASQCLHCREQRKNKNLHISCTCGKKGKSPGTHLALCLCHKNSHCTCSSKVADKRATSLKAELTRRRLLLDRSSSEINIGKDVSANGSFKNSSTTSPIRGPPPGISQSAVDLALDPHYVFEDVPIPFEAGGLFDLFSPSPPPPRNGNDPLNPQQNSQTQLSTFSNGISDSTAISQFSPSTEAELSDLMFPLFPLVGLQSFDTTNKPLSKQVDLRRASLTLLQSLLQHGQEQLQPQQQQQQQQQHQQHLQQQQQQSQVHSHQPLHHLLSHYPPIRPRRPESVLSVTSNSSTATNISRSIDAHNGSTQGTYPISASAYPPVASYSQSSLDLSNLQQQQQQQQQQQHSMPQSKLRHKDLDLLGEYADAMNFGRNSVLPSGTRNSSMQSINSGDPLLSLPQTKKEFPDLNTIFSEENNDMLLDYDHYLASLLNPNLFDHIPSNEKFQTTPLRQYVDVTPNPVETRFDSVHGTGAGAGTNGTGSRYEDLGENGSSVNNENYPVYNGGFVPEKYDFN